MEMSLSLISEKNNMNEAYKESSSFEIFPEKPLMNFNDKMELQGNSAEGHILEQGMQGFGRFADGNRAHEAYETGGDPMGSEVPLLFPTLTGNNPGNRDEAGYEDSSNKEFNTDENED